MTNQNRFDGVCSSWVARHVLSITSNLVRCHALGMVVITLLVIGTGWVSTLDHRSTASMVYQSVNVDLGDAKAVVASADGWRLAHGIATRRSEDVENAAMDIAKWLPQRLEWTDVETRLRKVANSCRLDLSMVESGPRHTGSRVAVLTGQCQIQGGYGDLCKFLNALTQADLETGAVPISASEITLTHNARIPRSDGQAACHAVLKIRVPYGSPGTAAANLLPSDSISTSTEGKFADVSR
ncbi:hypothetical protein [Rubripirellula reticaptiva]|uniref:Pilus assembly protein, PilO n=1 Tax=Rubripirellula reticaptiva TaxID=2528013 RepID=A0A5C6EQW2_9BACT|nr:hypothetical protein [Rubripirellula reticaptiva]TWU49799.1 hypothetical protein Poly59_44240 [Rubripirellula reticaptiva]